MGAWLLRWSGAADVECSAAIVAEGRVGAMGQVIERDRAGYAGVAAGWGGRRAQLGGVCARLV